LAQSQTEAVYIDIILKTMIEGKKNIFWDDFTLSFVALQRKWRRVQLIIGNSNMVVLLYISLHSLFDKMLYSVYVHSKNIILILYGSI
jgi:hypothetical protein